MPGNSFDLYTLAASGINDVVISPDQTKIYASTASGQINVYSATSHSLLTSWNVGTSLGALSVSEDGQWIVAIGSTPAASVYRIDAANGGVTTFSAAGNTFFDIEAINNQTALITGSQGGSGYGEATISLNFTTGLFGPSPLTGGVTLTESGRYTLIGNDGLGPGSFWLYDDVTNTQVSTGPNLASGVNFGLQAINQTVGLIAQFSYYQTITITNLAFQPVITLQAGAPISAMAFSPDGQYFYYYETGTSSVQRVSTTTWGVAESFSLPGATWGGSTRTLGNEIVVSNDGTMIFVRSPNGILSQIDLSVRNETFAGTAGADTMAGGLGDDVYFVNVQGDSVTELPNEGNDSVYSSALSYSLTGNIEKLFLETGAINGTGDSSNNIIYGNAAANQLDGAGGNDTLLGNAGDDSILGGIGNDILNGGAGVDLMTGGAGDDVYIVDSVDDQIYESAGQGNDIVYTSGNYTLRAGVSAEVLLTDAPAATTAINLSGNEFGNAITGNAGANILLGYGGDDALIGLGGNDNLDGGAGLDITNGGAGDDIHIVDSVDDVVLEAAGEGRDLVFTSSNYVLRPGVSVELLLTTAQAAATAINLSGNELDNIIQGNAGSNILFGDAGADVILAFQGDDFINGGTGADILNGGPGDDIYFTDTIDDIVLEDAGNGRDMVYTTSNYTLRAGVSVELLLADPQSGTVAINLTGNEFDNNIQGNAGTNILFGGGGADLILGYAGADTLDGGTGIDTLIGGTGDDIYFVDSAADLIIENAGEGRDFVYASVSYTVVNGVDIEVLIADPAAGNGAINLTGNDLANTLQGGGGDNILFGGVGDDLLVGNGGNDQLNGGLGNDTMIGGLGDDTYVVDDASDVIVENAGEGFDTIATTGSYTLSGSGSIEVLRTADANGTTAINLTGDANGNGIIGNEGMNTLLGGAGNDSLNGGAGDDVIDGGIGVDRMYGGAGDDTIYVDDVTTPGNAITGDWIDGGDGTDTVLTTVSIFAGTTNFQSVENFSVADPASTTAINIYGHSGDNVIQGNDGKNFLRGGGGLDTLRGFGGDDTLIANENAVATLVGGAGNDAYVLNTGALIMSADIVEIAGEGYDTVYTLGTFVLAAGVSIEEVRVSQGYFGVNSLTGNELANTLKGDQLGSSDTLIGGGGDDVLIGYGSLDTLTGGAGADTFVLSRVDEFSVTTITDFEHGSDRIEFSAAGFSALGAGPLAASSFVSGTAALDADDRIIYNTANGALFYDADGNGAGAAVQIASFTGAPTLTAADFVII